MDPITLKDGRRMWDPTMREADKPQEPEANPKEIDRANAHEKTRRELGIDAAPTADSPIDEPDYTWLLERQQELRERQQERDDPDPLKLTVNTNPVNTVPTDDQAPADKENE